MADRAAAGGRSFAEALRHHRVRAGLTQEELAAAAGLSVRGLRYLERGLRHPTRDTVQRLIAALALPPSEGSVLARAARTAPDGFLRVPWRGGAAPPPRPPAGPGGGGRGRSRPAR